MWKSLNDGSNQYMMFMIDLWFWNIRNCRNSMYRTDTPNKMRHTAGCGRVNGPFGKASTEIIKKKNITHNIPAQMFSSPLVSLLM